MTDILPILLTFNTSILAGSVAPSSMAMYERDFKVYLAYAGMPEMAMQATTFARWRTHLVTTTTMSPNTINRMMSAVKRLMKEAESQGYVPKGTYADFKHVDGVRNVAMKKNKKTHARVRIEPADMRRLCDLPNPATLHGLRDRALLHTLASSGLRVHEVASLTEKQIFFSAKGCQLRVLGKNDEDERNALLSQEAHHYIEQWLDKRPVVSPYLFTSFAGRGDRLTDKPMKEMSIWRMVRIYAAQIGLDNIKPHDFRRFLGTQLARTNPRAAQKALGHKKISTTMDNYVLDDLEIGISDTLY
jgi:site-specific recombinase XerD